MPTIEERAEEYAKDHAPTRIDGKPLSDNHHWQLKEIIRDAYLAGSVQTQADYAHYIKSRRDIGLS